MRTRGGQTERPRADSTDRRRVLIEPTEEGKQRAESTFRELRVELDRYLATYEERDLVLLRDFLRKVGRTFVERAQAGRSRRKSTDPRR